jgi:hypothetical protein
MSGLLSRKLDNRPLDTIMENNSRAGDGSKVDMFLSRKGANADGMLKLSGADYGGVGFGDRVE